jgi:membrane carboxypeptidase/penicillin-binding protein
LEQQARSQAELLGISYSEPQKMDELEFAVPDGVEPFWVYKSSGVKAPEGADGAILEYFVKGTEPETYSDPQLSEEEESSSSYLESPDL